MLDNLSEIQKAAQINANIHGWYIQWKENESIKQEILSRLPVQRNHRLSVGDALNMIHDEVSEAYVDYTTDNFENLAMELADIFIRTFAMTGDLGYYKLEQQLINRLQYADISLTCLQYISSAILRCENADLCDLNGEAILCIIHEKASKANEGFRDDDIEKFNTFIIEMLVWTFYFAQINGINVIKAILKKMEINKTRPVLHGRVIY